MRFLFDLFELHKRMVYRFISVDFHFSLTTLIRILRNLVGARGFEPPAPCAQGRCAKPNCATPRQSWIS